MSHKSSSPGVKQEWLHRIHTETGGKIKKHLWACYCNITQVRSVGEAAGAAEKLVTSISSYSVRIPVGAPGSGDIPYTKESPHKSKETEEKWEDMSFWALPKNVTPLQNAKMGINIITRSYLQSQG